MIKTNLETTIILEGVKVYDPRDNIMKVSDNPALVYADLLNRYGKSEHLNDETFWLTVINMANYCDSKLD